MSNNYTTEIKWYIESQYGSDEPTPVHVRPAIERPNPEDWIGDIGDPIAVIANADNVTYYDTRAEAEAMAAYFREADQNQDMYYDVAEEDGGEFPERKRSWQRQTQHRK